MSKTVKERFDAKWTLEPETGCWVWTGALTSGGYGKMSTEISNVELAHRVSYRLYVGPIPDETQVNHGPCHNRRCVNPAHIYAGNDKSNSADKVRDGTRQNTSGENNPNAKLTAAQVAEIRERYSTGLTSLRTLAEEYEISKMQVRNIVRRKSW